MPTVTYAANVDLSQFHAGQIIEHSAEMRAIGHEYKAHTDAFGRPVMAIKFTGWQAVHHTLDRSDRSSTSAESPWVGTMAEAERWLEDRGLVIGGAYWHTRRELAGEVTAEQMRRATGEDEG